MFAALLFWVGSYTLSRESQRLERRLGVGTRDEPTPTRLVAEATRGPAR